MVGVTLPAPELRARSLGAHAQGLDGLTPGPAGMAEPSVLQLGHPVARRGKWLCSETRQGVRVRMATQTRTPCAPRQSCSALA